jgi:hypothetical protein
MELCGKWKGEERGGDGIGESGAGSEESAHKISEKNIDHADTQSNSSSDVA